MSDTTVSYAWTFDRPPVIEVVVAVELLPIGEFTTVQFAQMAAQWATDYPGLLEIPASPPSAPTPDSGFPMPVFIGFPGVRLMLTSDDNAYLVQVQRDRLVLNWRRTAPDANYPRFSAVKERFTTLWQQLVQSAPEGSLQPATAEVTYVNRLVPTEGDWPAAPFRLIDPAGLPTDVAPTVRFQLVTPVRGISTGLVGVTASTAEPDGADSAQHLYTVSTRLDLAGGEVSPESALDDAHKLSVDAFMRSTRSTYHEVWGVNPR